MQKLRNTFFYLDIYFVKENEWSGFYNFHFEQKSGFKLERNKDCIIIDISWYEKNYRDNYLGHIAHP